MLDFNAFSFLGLGIAALVIFALFILLIYLVVSIFYCLTLYKALKYCAPNNRNLDPNLVWLLLIPGFNVIWQFVVVIQVSSSLEKEFRYRNISKDEDMGKMIGLAGCILPFCTVIPLIGEVAAIGGLVCWIMYWVKISGYSNQLIATPHTCD